MSDTSSSKDDAENILGSAPAFRIHDRVRKVRGASWQGRVCGTYSTALTPEGYMVESEREVGSVQFYPAAALEAVPASYPVSQICLLEQELVDSQHRLVGALQRAAAAEEQLEQMTAHREAGANRRTEIKTIQDWMRELSEDERPPEGEAFVCTKAGAGDAAEWRRAGWQPIETAPKDGTPVLLCGGQDDCADVIGLGEERLFKAPCRAAWHDAQWLMTFADAGWERAYYESPTHWMPLPEPPPPQESR